MPRCCRSAAWMWIVAAILLLGVLAARGASALGEEATGPAAGESAIVELSGIVELRMEDEEELGLTAEQRAKLRAIGRELYDELRRDWVPAGGIAAAQPDSGPDETRRRRIMEIRRQVEGVLTADQLERLEQISLRTPGVAALADPETLDRLGLDTGQRKRIELIREQMQEGMWKLWEESFQKMLDQLTPEQRKRLKELVGEGVGT